MSPSAIKKGDRIYSITDADGECAIITGRLTVTSVRKSGAFFARGGEHFSAKNVGKWFRKCDEDKGWKRAIGSVCACGVFVTHLRQGDLCPVCKRRQEDEQRKVVSETSRNRLMSLRIASMERTTERLKRAMGKLEAFLDA